jgi:hypothetical protein
MTDLKLVAILLLFIIGATTVVMGITYLIGHLLTRLERLQEYDNFDGKMALGSIALILSAMIAAFFIIIFVH